MKRLNDYKLFTEGVRDKMTPKSDEDVKNILSDNNAVDKVKNIFKYKLQHYYTEEELKDVIKSALEYMTFAEQTEFAIDYDLPWIIEDLYKEGYFDFESVVKDTILKAFKQGNIDIIRLLLKNGVDVNYIDTTTVGKYLPPEKKKELRKLLHDHKWNLDTLEEGVRDRMTPKSVDEINDMISSWTSREKYLKGIKLGVKYLEDEGLRLMKKFENVQIGDYLTIAVPIDATEQQLCKIKEKYTFNNKEEFKDYLREHPNIIIDSNALKILFKTFPNKKRDVVVVNITYDMMFEYRRNCGVFTYTDEEIENNKSERQDHSSEMKSRFHDEYLEESVRSKMTPKLPDDVRRTHYNLIFWKLLVRGKMSEELKKITTHYSRAIEVAKELGITNEPKTPWQRELMMFLHVLDGVKGSNDELVGELLRIVNSLDINREQAAIYVGIKNFVERKYTETNLKFKENMGSNIMNESVRDAMTPKGEEEIRKSLESAPPQRKLKIGANQNLNWLIKQAIEEGIDMTSVENNSQIIPLCKNGNTEMVRLLVDNGADININGGVCLQRAVDSKNADLVKLLVELGADVHVNIDYAIRWAAYNNNLKMVKVLLDAGAKANVAGGFPLKMATKRGNNEMIELLKKYIKK